MLNWNEYLQLSAGLISVVNPIGVIPIFLSLTENRSIADRNQTAIVCAFSVAMVLGVALIAGEPILHFFGIGLPAFKVAGGLLVLLMGISMLNASPDRVRHTPEERVESFDKESVAVVPLAIPLAKWPRCDQYHDSVWPYGAFFRPFYVSRGGNSVGCRGGFNCVTVSAKNCSIYGAHRYERCDSRDGLNYCVYRGGVYR